MKKFLKRLAIFTPAVILLLLASYAVNRWLIRSDRYIIAGDIRTLIIGDSHARRALNPNIIEASVNISMGGEPYIVTLRKLERILCDNPGIQNVVMGLTWLNLSGIQDERFRHPRSSKAMFDRYYPLVDLDDLSQVPVDYRKYLQSLIRNEVLPNRQYAANLLKRSFNRGAPSYPYIGGFIFDVIAPEDQLSLEETIEKQFYPNGRDAVVSQTSINALFGIVSLAGERGVNLFLVATPLHSDYIEKVPADIKSAFKECRGKIAETQGVRFLDYRREIESDIGGLFMDYNHVNMEGAEIISRKVAEVINSTAAEEEGQKEVSP